MDHNTRLYGSHTSGEFATEQGGLSVDVIKKSFDATEEKFLQLVKHSWPARPQMVSVGSCCLVGAIKDGILYVANLGDSRAVLGRKVVGGPSTRGVQVRAERLSTDHNVGEEEVRREVKEQHPDDPQIVVHSRGVWRIKGIIQVSRSIGDVYLKKPEFTGDPLYQQFAVQVPLKRSVMSAEPSIQIRRLKQHDLFLIFASDGLWEQLSDEMAVEIVFKSPRAGIAKRLVRAALTEAARKREMRYDDIKRIEKGIRRHFHDDISVIVIYLDHHLRPSRFKGSTECTSSPVDIFSHNAGVSDEDPLRPVS
ncbi:probable protein phosphatase 2C 78 isoform X2 [Magnolia sinica]|uniref:probable protein phosphatase 2C 78 isoform X2 n=1 Tax=Magnolia sinica TaxID=86752 RepID=UPI002659997D|nr:probable protein phosphatase 2C 78 isoform X2 [Magnolia sinica]